MKQNIFRALFPVGCTLALLTACGQQSSVAEQPESSQERVVLSAQVRAEHAYLIKTWEDLCEKSDVILSCTATNVDTEVLKDGSDRIATYFTPSNVTVYKGEYQAERLQSPGGEMPMENYISQLPAELQHGYENLPLSEQQTMTLDYMWETTPVVHEGDTVLFFAEYVPDTVGVLQSVNFSQGTFIVEDGNIPIKEGYVEEHLIQNLTDRFGIGTSAKSTDLTDAIP